MTTPELVDLLRHAYDGDPWHGPSLAAVLQSVTADAAAARPIDGRHSIWEIVLHVTAWTREVERRLRGGVPGEPAEGDWPLVPRTTADAWHADLAALTTAHASLVAVVAAQPDGQWTQTVGTLRDPAAGTGVSFGVMIVGLATHHAYHAGQIALLK